LASVRLARAGLQPLYYSLPFETSGVPAETYREILARFAMGLLRTRKPLPPADSSIITKAYITTNRSAPGFAMRDFVRKLSRSKPDVWYTHDPTGGAGEYIDAWHIRTPSPPREGVASFSGRRRSRRSTRWSRKTPSLFTGGQWFESIFLLR